MFYGIAVSLGGSRYRDETRVECMFQWSVRTRRVWKNLPWTWRHGKFYALIVLQEVLSNESTHTCSLKIEIGVTREIEHSIEELVKQNDVFRHI